MAALVFPSPYRLIFRYPISPSASPSYAKRHFSPSLTNIIGNDIAMTSQWHRNDIAHIIDKVIAERQIKGKEKDLLLPLSPLLLLLSLPFFLEKPALWEMTSRRRNLPGDANSIIAIEKPHDAASHLHSGTRRTQNSTMCEYYTNPRFSDRTLVTLSARRRFWRLDEIFHSSIFLIKIHSPRQEELERIDSRVPCTPFQTLPFICLIKLTGFHWNVVKFFFTISYFFNCVLN